MSENQETPNEETPASNTGMNRLVQGGLAVAALMVVALVGFTGYSISNDGVSAADVQAAIDAEAGKLSKAQALGKRNAIAAAKAKAEAAALRDELAAALEAGTGDDAEDDAEAEVSPVAARPESGALDAGPTEAGVIYVSQQDGTEDFSVISRGFGLNDKDCQDTYPDGRFPAKDGRDCPAVDLVIRDSTSAHLVLSELAGEEVPQERGVNDYAVKFSPDEDGKYPAITTACVVSLMTGRNTPEGLWCPEDIEIAFDTKLERQKSLLVTEGESADDQPDAAQSTDQIDQLAKLFSDLLEENEASQVKLKDALAQLEALKGS